MNSLRRPRRRPRVRSVNFRTFADLLFRVAAWNILHPRSTPGIAGSYARDFFRAPRVMLYARARHMVTELPERRYYP